MRLKVVGVGAVYFLCFFSLFIGSVAIVSEKSADISGNGQTSNNTAIEGSSTDETEQALPQVPTATQLEIVWNRTYGGNDTEHASSVIGTADGGFLLAGLRGVSGAGSDMLLLRVDGDGKRVWERTYGGVGIDGAIDVVQSDDGCFAVAGHTGVSSGSDAYFLKVDAEGNVVWNRTYGDAGEQGAACIVDCGEGDYMAAGWNNGHLYLLRLDGDGNLVWSRTYGSISSLDCTGIVRATGGDYIAWGGIGSSGTYLLWIDDGGNKTREKTLQGTLAGDVVYVSDGGCIVAGVDAGDISLSRVDAQGNKIWQRTYRRHGSDNAACIIYSGNGAFVVGGSASLEHKGPPTYEELPVGGAYLLKVDDQGEAIWEKEYPFTETGLHHVADIVPCGPAEFVVVGARPYDPQTRWDLFLVKLVDRS